MTTDSLLAGASIRGLTLWRPWPWAFTDGAKRCENRTWKPPASVQLGFLALHAGKRFDHGAAAAMREGEFGAAGCEVPSPGEHLVGAITAIGFVSGFRQIERKTYTDGTYEFGPFVWDVPDVLALNRPVPARGSQGVWKLTPAALQGVREQAEEWAASILCSRGLQEGAPDA